MTSHTPPTDAELAEIEKAIEEAKNGPWHTAHGLTHSYPKLLLAEVRRLRELLRAQTDRNDALYLSIRREGRDAR